MFGQGKSTNVTFDNVAGLQEAKEEVNEIVDFLKSPKKNIQPLVLRYLKGHY
jgi:cell division protease FtsH